MTWLDDEIQSFEKRIEKIRSIWTLIVISCSCCCEWIYQQTHKEIESTNKNELFPFRTPCNVSFNNRTESVFFVLKIHDRRLQMNHAELWCGWSAVCVCNGVEFVLQFDDWCFLINWQCRTNECALNFNNCHKTNTRTRAFGFGLGFGSVFGTIAMQLEASRVESSQTQYQIKSNRECELRNQKLNDYHLRFGVLLLNARWSFSARFDCITKLAILHQPKNDRLEWMKRSNWKSPVLRFVHRHRRHAHNAFCNYIILFVEFLCACAPAATHTHTISEIPLENEPQ